MSKVCEKCLAAAGITKSKRGDLDLYTIKNKLSETTFSTYGAHICSFIPAGQKDVLWLSGLSSFKRGVALRGGIPVCWPWFGPAGDPMHGTGRIVEWTFDFVQAEPDGSTTVILALDETQRYGLKVWLKLNAGTSLSVELSTLNTGSKPYQLSDALHTYFNVSEIQKTTVIGLDGLSYFDKTQGMQTFKQEGDIHFCGETDRVYQSVKGVIVFKDETRSVKVERSGSDSAVVWNPWIEKSKKIAEFDPEAWHSMLCVEATNAGNDVIALQPGSIHTLATRITVL